MSKYCPQFAGDFKSFLDRMRGQKTAVLGHFRPDGDCIGSQVALCRALNQLGIEAVALNPDPVPPYLKAFVGNTPFRLTAEFKSEGHAAVAVDSADRSRLGQAAQALFPLILLNVDHHLTNDHYGQCNLVDGTASATAEILAGLLLDQGINIDAVMAQALYVGIATDTVQFRANNTTRSAFAMSARLMELGAKPAAAAVELYERESMAKMRLLQHFLASLKFECGGRACIGILPKGIYAQTGAVKSDSEGLVDYARAIEGVEIGVLLEEKEHGLKGSLRAKYPQHRLDQLAKGFNGGGHACAAGFNSDGTLETFYPKFVAVLQDHFARCDQTRA